jgi:hypothetical protein
LYIVASPQKTILFEMLVANDQAFGVSMDTLQPDASLKFTGTDEHERFLAYTRFIAPKAMEAEAMKKELEAAADAAKKAEL